MSINNLFDHEVERSLLSSMVSRQKSQKSIADRCSEELFHLESHRNMFRAIRRMLDAGDVVDFDTLRHQMQMSGNDLGIGMDYVKVDPGVIPAKQYIRILRKLYQLREQVKMAEQILAKVSKREEPDDIYAFVNTENQRIQRGEAEYTLLKDRIPEAMKRLEERKRMRGESKSGVIGQPSGLHELDRRTSGFGKGELIVIGGRPAMGKSALKKKAEMSTAAMTGKVILSFSLEMGQDEEDDRVIAALSGVDGFKISTGLLDEQDFERITDAYGLLEKMNIIVDDTPAISLQELKSKARAVAMDYDLGMVTVDYIQLMSGSGNGSREQQLGEISRGLKELAKELQVPVLAVSQLSRAVETRGGDKRPILSDLRETGSLEQDANTVLLVYRAEYYGLNEFEGGASTKGVAEIIIAKQRKGPTGEAMVGWNSKVITFENLVEPTPTWNDNGMPF